MQNGNPPSVLTRGSAPEGTFQIPEEGLQVPEERSFLSRFRNGLWKQTPLPIKQLDSALDSVSYSTDPPPPTPVDYQPDNKPHIDLISASVASIPLGRLSSQSLQADPPTIQSELTSDAPVDDDHQQIPIHSTPSENSKALEEAADEAEDTLIEVVPEHDSLLNEARESYPILRFCAANALLDQPDLDALGLPLGFVWSPFGELRDIKSVSRAANRCATCGSFMAKGNGGEDVLSGSRFWTCGFCGRNDNDAGQASFQAKEKPDEYPELTTDTVEYLHSESAVKSSVGYGAIVLIVDENLEEEEAEWAKAAVAAVHASAAESGLKFSLITVGAGCSIAVQGGRDNHSVPILETMSVARASKLTTQDKERFFLGPPAVDTNGDLKTGSGRSETSPVDTNAFISARAAPSLQNAGSQVVEEQHEGIPQKTRLRRDSEPRRLDMAISVAFELISGMADSENSRILSLITGPPTLAEHALRRNYIDKEGKLRTAPLQNNTESDEALEKLYEQIGSKAGDMRIALDFLCFGTPYGFAGPILLGAAKRSRGGLVYTAAHSFSAAPALAEAATFLAQRSTSPGVVSMRVSSPLMVARVIGPAFPTAAPHTYAVPGIDPTAGFTVILLPKAGAEADGNLPSHAVVQLAAKSLSSTRVVTARIPITRSSTEYVRAADVEICALVLGKACIVTGGGLTQPLVAAKSLDLAIRRLLVASETSAGVARLLFELRRGLLLERQIHPDCSLVLRSFYLRTDCTIASLLMSPRLFTNAMSDESTGLMAEVALDKSYITNDAVLVLDTGLNVFVYVGGNASAEAEEAISESARSVAAHRQSPCQLWKLHPGQEADYLLDSYLSPSNAELPNIEPGKDGSLPSAMEMSFLQYCTMLAPECETVQLLQN